MHHLPASTAVLLVKARKLPDIPLMTDLFFLGFLLLLPIEMLVTTPTS